jgi:hypothetical protein
MQKGKLKPYNCYYVKDIAGLRLQYVNITDADCQKMLKVALWKIIATPRYSTSPASYSLDGNRLSSNQQYIFQLSFPAHIQYGQKTAMDGLATLGPFFLFLTVVLQFYVDIKKKLHAIPSQEVIDCQYTLRHCNSFSPNP